MDLNQRLAEIPSPGPTAEDRFWSKVLMVENCWEWIGGRTGSGYGVLWVNGKDVSAHRFSYELHRGPIPAGLAIDHLCRNRGCVNPDHMEPVTTRENLLRGVSPVAVNHVKTHCKNGHELTKENIREYEQPNGHTHRRCKPCQSRNHRAWLARKRESGNV